MDVDADPDPDPTFSVDAHLDPMMLIRIPLSFRMKQDFMKICRLLKGNMYLFNVVDRHYFDGDPKPTFSF